MELVNMLTEQLGISEEQASGGAGLIFNLAKEKLGGDFSQITDAIPDVNGLLEAAPETGGGIMGAIGGLAGAFGGDKLGGLMSLAGGFSDLGLDSGSITSFVPVVLEFVKEKAGDSIGGLLEGILS